MAKTRFHKIFSIEKNPKVTSKFNNKTLAIRQYLKLDHETFYTNWTNYKAGLMLFTFFNFLFFRRKINRFACRQLKERASNSAWYVQVRASKSILRYYRPLNYLFYFSNGLCLIYYLFFNYLILPYLKPSSTQNNQMSGVIFV